MTSNQPVKNSSVKNDSRCIQEGNPGTSADTQCVPPGTSVVIINDPARRDMEEAAANQALLRARQEEAARTLAKAISYRGLTLMSADRSEAF